MRLKDKPNNTLIMTREKLPFFEGRENVTHTISENGLETWLTTPIPFKEEANRTGACKLNTLETETKHVLFLFNSSDEEVGRYYLGKLLQGKHPNELVTMLDKIVAFESYNYKTQQWVPCVGESVNTTIASSAVKIPVQQEGENIQNANFKARKLAEKIKQEIPYFLEHLSFSSDFIKGLSWEEYNELMISVLSKAGFKQMQYVQGEYQEVGPLENDFEPKYFASEILIDSDRVEHLKTLGLLNNGRCPLCGNIIVGEPGRYTNRFDRAINYQICQSCVKTWGGVKTK